MLRCSSVKRAATRLGKFGLLKRTPLVTSRILNDLLGHNFFFKAECMQVTGAFKARGGLNSVASLLEEHGAAAVSGPVCAFSSGNHAQAVAWACRELELPCEIYMPRNVSPLKIQATESYGAKVIVDATRRESELRCAEAASADGAFMIPPFDYDDVITGQGTVTLEALQDLKAQDLYADAVCGPIGGGGLMSGTYLGSRCGSFKNPRTGAPPICLGAEPLAGNDCVQSLEAGKIVALSEQPDTMCDGAMTMAVSERTFQYLQLLESVIGVPEHVTAYWTQWLTHLLKLAVEPTGVLGMAAAVRWLQQQEQQDGQRRNIVVILSGGNIAHGTRQKVWSTDMLCGNVPSLKSG